MSIVLEKSAQAKIPWNIATLNWEREPQKSDWSFSEKSELKDSPKIQSPIFMKGTTKAKSKGVMTKFAIWVATRFKENKYVKIKQITEVIPELEISHQQSQNLN